MYRMLDPEKIVSTADALARRVSGRFPDSGLAHIAGEFVEMARAVSAVSTWLAAPHRPVRTLLLLGLILVGLTAAGLVLALDLRVAAFSSLSDLAQGLDAAISDVVFIGIAVFFLLSLEARIKRKRAVGAIRQLRAMAHIIDMHQLTKDLEHIEGREDDLGSAPERRLNAVELTRYLNYSTELLALISKLSALLVQGFDDPVTLGAVNEIEDLTAGMSRKIWQKITILDRFLPDGEGPPRQYR